MDWLVAASVSEKSAVFVFRAEVSPEDGDRTKRTSSESSPP
jgi:hypothetical protein